MESQDAEEVNSLLLRYVRGELTFEQWQREKQATENASSGGSVTVQSHDDREQNKEDEVVVTAMVVGPQGGSGQAGMTVQIKEEPQDSEEMGQQSPDEQEEDQGDVVYLGTEIVLKYLSGELSFSELHKVMEEELKEETPDPYQLELGGMEEVTATAIEQGGQTEGAGDGEKKEGAKRTRRPRQKLPKKLQGLMGEANIRFARGQKDDAIKLCMEVIKLASNAPEPYQTLGMIYEDLGDSEKSLQFQLIAAHLSNNNSDEWVQLAEMSLEQENVPQALSCYDRAIKADPSKVPLWWARCDLLQSAGEKKKAVEGYVQILELLGEEEGEIYFKLAQDLTKTFYAEGEKERAMLIMAAAFRKHPTRVTVVDTNLLLELYIAHQKYTEALQTLLQHSGVELEYEDGTSLGGVNHCVADIVTLADRPVVRCNVPLELAIDLRSKLVVSLIHLQCGGCVDSVLAPLMSENPDEVGDLYLDVAEAFIDKDQNAEAIPFLFSLVHSENYNLAAVWLKYAECLNAVGRLKDAVHAFKQVIELAPTHKGARLSLSALQQQLGRPEEALQVLQQGESLRSDLEETLDLNIQLSLPKCLLLHSQKRWQEFIDNAIDVLFGQFPGILNHDTLTFLVGKRSHKHKMEQIGIEVDEYLENRLRDARLVLSKEGSITQDNLWDLYNKLCDVLLAQERYKDMESVSIASTIHPSFGMDPEKQARISHFVVHACLLSNQGQNAYDFIRDLVLKDLDNNQSWNLFAQVIAISQNIRHNRFCLRLMCKYPDHKALGILNGHNALVAGTYKHALAEYVTGFRLNPQDPFLSFCIGVVFIHLTSQKFARKRHSLSVQACAFLNQYLELRGEGQETYYNLGRAMHQLGLLHAAVFYYNKGLECPCAVPEQPEIFDLSREIAFNLCLIYKNSGSYQLASLITQKYLVI